MQQQFANQPSTMEEKPHGQTVQTAVPTNGHGSSTTPGGKPVYKTPVWVKVVRGFQILIGLIVMVLAGLLIHGKLLDEVAFALMCGLFTWIVCIYALVTEIVSGARQAYNVYAILALDTLMAIFWLSSMGAVAALRTSFKYPVNIYGCYDDGSAIDASTCIVGRDLEKRAAVANSSGLAAMSGIAGVSALEMLMFIATGVWLFLEWRKSRPAGPTPSAVEMNTGFQNNNAAPGPQYQQHPAQPVQPQHTGQPAMPQQPQQPQTFAPSPASGYSAAQVQPQFSGQQQPQQQVSPHYGQQPMPYQQVPTPGPQGTYNELPGQQTNNMYSPSVSPAPQNQFQAPAQPYSPAPQELPSQQQYQQYPPQQYPH